MKKKLCPIQDTCTDYDSGSNLPPNNDVRHKYPCQKWVDMTCIMGLELYKHYFGNYPACSIKKRT